MGVDYTAKAGVGFFIGYGDENREQVFNVLNENRGSDDITQYIEEHFKGDFELDYSGNYNYTGDEDSINILITKTNYKDDDGLFIERVNEFFCTQLKEEDIDVVSDIEVW